jgi:hypothetical protein
MLNDKYLWKVAPNEEDYDKDDESIADHLFTHSADAKKMYKNNNDHAKKTCNGNPHIY